MMAAAPAEFTIRRIVVAANSSAQGQAGKSVV